LNPNTCPSSAIERIGIFKCNVLSVLLPIGLLGNAVWLHRGFIVVPGLFYSSKMTLLEISIGGESISIQEIPNSMSV